MLHDLMDIRLSLPQSSFEGKCVANLLWGSQWMEMFDLYVCCILIFAFLQFCDCFKNPRATGERASVTIEAAWAYGKKGVPEVRFFCPIAVTIHHLPFCSFLFLFFLFLLACLLTFDIYIST